MSVLFPTLAQHFLKETKPIKFADGLVISKDDMNLNWTGWMVKNDKLISDVADGVFEVPFLFMSDVVATDPSISDINVGDGGEISSANKQTDEATKTPAEKSEGATPSIFDLDGDEFAIAPRRVGSRSSAAYSQMDAQIEQEWLQSRLGDDAQLVDDMIELADGTRAMGALKESSILLWLGAEEGTAYHEAYHKISLLVLDRRERMGVYEMVREQNAELRNSTNEEIEEYLAEGFREYMLNKASKKRPSRIKRIFSKIRYFISHMAGMRYSDINRLYEDIDSGVFKSKKTKGANIAEFKARYGKYKDVAPKRIKSYGMTTITDANTFYDVVSGLTYYLVKGNNVASLEAITPAHFEILKNTVRATIADPKSENVKALFTDILDNFDNVFVPEIQKSIAKMGLQTIGTDEDSSELDMVMDKGLQVHFKASYETSKIDNLSSEVKFFMSTILDSVVKDGVTTMVRNANTMMPRFVNYKLAWNTVIADLSNEMTVESMMAKISELAKSKNSGLYPMLLKKLSEVDNNFLTKFWSGVYSHRNQFINISHSRSAEKDGMASSLLLVDSDIDRATRKLPMEWGENMVYSGNIYKQTESGLEFLAGNVEAILKEFDEISKIGSNVTLGKSNMLIDEAEILLGRFARLFHQIGIDIDAETLEEIIKTRYPKRSRVKAIASLVSNDSKNFEPAFIFSNLLKRLYEDGGKMSGSKKNKPQKDLFNREKSVRTIAAAYAKTHPSIQESTVLGPKNNKFYAISLRNYIINTFNKLNYSANFRRKLNSVLYNTGVISADGRIPGSLILDQLRTGEAKRADIKTYIKFYESDSSDTGRDYFDISELEDYVIKMAAALNSFIVLPTMADKKTYYMINGFKLPNYVTGNDRLSYSVSNKDGINMASVVFPTSTINIFNNYFETEFVTIKEAWKQYSEALGNEKKLIKTYHYGGKDSRTGKKWAAGHGNGLRFRHFDMLYINGIVGGKEVSTSVNLNDIIDGFIIEHGEVAGMDIAIKFIEDNCMNISQHDKLVNMNNTLSSALKSELEYASSIGLIEYSGGVNGAKNISLDAAVFNRILKEYQGADGHALTAEHSSVLNMIANNMVNGIISSVEFEKIISKDPAFYGDADAKVKRFSSILSTGTDLRVDFPVGHELHGKNTFTVAEMADNIISSEAADAIEQKILISQFNELVRNSGKLDVENIQENLDSLISEFAEEYEMATSIAKRMTEGYRKVDSTDGAAFISPEMYRSILIRLGQWTDDMQVAFDIIESEDESWMADDTKYLYIMDIVLNPLKMIYFGDNFKGNLDMPILNKMAMFCLFKPVATGDLRHLYNRMVKPQDGQRKIDMVAVGQAVKVGGANQFKFYTDETNNTMADLTNIESRDQNYEYLRHQLITDPHHEEKISISWQPVKIAMSNIVPDRTYVNLAINGEYGVTGEQLTEEWRNAIVELSKRGSDKVIKRLGLVMNPVTGAYDLDKKKLFEMLASDAASSGLSDDVVEMINGFNPEIGDKSIIQSMFDNSWVESDLISFIMKNTVDVSTPGGSFIQMSAFGLNKTSDNDAKYVLNGGKKLNLKNDDGTMDCAVSIRLFKDVIPSELKNKSFDKQKAWLELHGLIGEYSNPGAIGYRIPSQGLSSISPLRIVDVIDARVGDTIILPLEFTRLTGSDFDIDKLFVARYNYRKGPSGRVEKVLMDDSIANKWENASEEAIQNRLLDTMMASLTDPMSVHETLMSLDLAVDAIKEDILPDIDMLSKKQRVEAPFRFSVPSFQTKKKVEYSSGRGGIGPFALANSNHPLTQMSRLKFIDTEALSKFDLTRLDRIYGNDSIRILDWVSALISAHVDVAKDPYIIRLGVNKHTYKFASFLFRTGMGGKSFYFLSQPIMKELYASLDKK